MIDLLGNGTFDLYLLHMYIFEGKTKGYHLTLLETIFNEIFNSFT